jgi:hypothetical protein
VRIDIQAYGLRYRLLLIGKSSSLKIWKK